MATELDRIRQDLKHQLSIPEELDWDYFLDTAKRAKAQADVELRNFTPSYKPKPNLDILQVWNSV